MADDDNRRCTISHSIICCTASNFKTIYSEVAWKSWKEIPGKEEREYKRLIEKYAISEIGNDTISAIRTDQINRILNVALEEEGVEAAFYLKKGLNLIFQYCQEKRWIGRINPVEYSMAISKPRQLLRIFNKDEEVRIMKACSEFRQGALVYIVFSYGIMPNRLLALKECDIDKNNMRIHITKRMVGRNVYFLRNQQHIAVDEDGLKIFEKMIHLNIRMNELRQIEYAMRCHTSILDFSYRICIDSFIIRMLKLGINPIDLREYYGDYSMNTYFYYMLHLDEDCPDYALELYMNS